MKNSYDTQPVYAGMATMPSRMRTARIAIRSLLPQVDRIFLYLDGFEQLPSFANHPKIEVISSEDAPGLHANGKLLGMINLPKNSYYMTVDDDYRYPRNFVSKLKGELLANPSLTVVGVHGCKFQYPFQSYTKDRIVYTSWKPLRELTKVDLVATCGTMHFVKKLQFDVRKWNVTNQVDLHFANEVKKVSGVVALVPKRWFWMLPLDSNQKDSIFKKLKFNDRRQSELAKRIFQL
jgi:hypothetical protein